MPAKVYDQSRADLGSETWQQSQEVAGTSTNFNLQGGDASNEFDSGWLLAHSP